MNPNEQATYRTRRSEMIAVMRRVVRESLPFDISDFVCGREEDWIEQLWGFAPVDKDPYSHTTSADAFGWFCRLTCLPDAPTLTAEASSDEGDTSHHFDVTYGHATGLDAAAAYFGISTETAIALFTNCGRTDIYLAGRHGPKERVSARRVLEDFEGAGW